MKGDRNPYTSSHVYSVPNFLILDHREGILRPRAHGRYRGIFVVALLLSRVQLYDAMDCSPPVSSVHGISQARILEWVAVPFSRGFSRPRDGAHVPALAGECFTTEPPGKGYKKNFNLDLIYFLEL